MYYQKKSDNKGYVHSIDNFIGEYFLKVSVNKAIEKLQVIGEKSTDYWEKLNCTACTKWSWYQNHIHLDTGFYISVGAYVDFDKKTKEKRLLPKIKIEVNPNKHHDKLIFKELLQFIKEDCSSGEIKRIDYAVDVPVVPDDIQIFKTLKEKGLYKGTRYFGQRNKHGFCRIYDKALESRLDTPLTRIEHTISNLKKPSLEKFCVATENKQCEALTSTAKVIVNLALQVKALGGDYTDTLKCLDKRTRYKIEPFLSQGYEEYQWDLSILDKLVNKISELFYIDYVPDDEPKQEELFSVDDNGFVILPDDYDLPFI